MDEADFGEEMREHLRRRASLNERGELSVEQGRADQGEVARGLEFALRLVRDGRDGESLRGMARAAQTFVEAQLAPVQAMIAATAAALASHIEADEGTEDFRQPEDLRRRAGELRLAVEVVANMISAMELRDLARERGWLEP